MRRPRAKTQKPRTETVSPRLPESASTCLGTANLHMIAAKHIASITCEFPEECLGDFPGAGALAKDRREPRRLRYVVANAPV